MIEQKRHAPRRYFVDAQGHRVLIGLSSDETAEFEALDLSSIEGSVPQATGDIGDGVVADNEVRWLELYLKHEGAWRTWITESRAEQAPTFKLY
ncbi:hypothetical protein [Bradyrhizobium guangzhouense]|uniref:Uncharacterized protein n=1 Tax=Bradyrhizobium guangzhouense TaxID=1325095 RepID=A0AAE6CAF2_9BRAD|nr:hypothetical protein [Bradyrhizobium guangzhouense]QAU48773.1 hypothetical protein XH91_27755 [Bradyrhizobium guangzhouense]RXH09204.1 hypothetical protein EAS56_26480 [Bradyrhizobium guangzhouense]